MRHTSEQGARTVRTWGHRCFPVVYSQLRKTWPIPEDLGRLARHREGGRTSWGISQALRRRPWEVLPVLAHENHGAPCQHSIETCIWRWKNTSPLRGRQPETTAVMQQDRVYRMAHFCEAFIASARTCSATLHPENSTFASTETMQRKQFLSLTVVAQLQS